jgi:hypothetical protein
MPGHVATDPTPPQPQDVTESPETAVIPDTLRAYPTLLIAFLRADMATVGRVYKLAQAIDRGDNPAQQTGWLYVDELRAVLADDDSPHRLFSWRRLRQILGEGEGVCWTRDDDGRLWLRGAARVAQALECERLNGHPVDLPTAPLLDGIQATKAHFYAAWHSGRRDASPMTRETIEQLTGIPPSTQRLYEDVAGIGTQQNYEIVDEYTPELLRATAWEHGGAFRYVDWQGKVGKRQTAYVARRLPNSFGAAHEAAAKGRQKKINRAIDLVDSRGRGTGRDVDRLYYQDAAAAAKAYGKDSSHDVYFEHEQALDRTAARPSKLRGVMLWGRLSPIPC